MKLSAFLLTGGAAAALYFMMRKAHGKTVVFIGDSLSKYPGGWQDQLTLKNNWLTYNLAKVGYTTPQMIGSYMDFKQPHDIAIIYAGANDVAAGLPNKATVDNIKRLRKLAIEKGAKPIVVTGYKQANDSSFQKNYQKLKSMFWYSLPGIVVPAITVSKDSVKDNVHMTDIRDHKRLADLIEFWAIR